MRSWLEKALAACVLTDSVEGYLLGRGAKEITIAAEGIVTWCPPVDPAPDPDFRKAHGEHGERLEGYLVCPVRSPRGSLIGFESRATHVKRIVDYRLPEAAWNPFWLGTRKAMPALWAGGDAWIVEGLFDMCPLEWAVPGTDAVLASVRAKLSKKHVEFLQRFCKGWVHMVYDRDATGRKSTVGWVDETGKHRYGALDVLQRVGLKCRDVFYSGGKDPGELWDKGGVAAIRAAFR